MTTSRSQEPIRHALAGCFEHVISRPVNKGRKKVKVVLAKEKQRD